MPPDFNVSASYRVRSVSLLQGTEVSFSLTCEHARALLPRFARSWLQVLSDELTPHGELVNLKGRDRGDVPRGTERSTPLDDHELFFYRGTLPDNSHTQHPFTLSINARFQGSRRGCYTYRPEMLFESEIAVTDPLFVTFSAPIYPEEFRGCIQRFSPRFFSSLLGVFPTVREEVIAGSLGNQLSLTVKSSLCDTYEAFEKSRAFALASRFYYSVFQEDLGAVFRHPTALKI